MKKLRLVSKKNLELYTLVDDEDYEELSKYNWCLSQFGYAMRNDFSGEKRKRVFMHRQIMNTPIGMITDHANGDKLDNRKSNLRICNDAQNIRNRPISKKNSSGYKGVSEQLGRWKVQIMANGKKVHIGMYATKEAAAIAYNKVAAQYFGEFAWMNKI